MVYPHREPEAVRQTIAQTGIGLGGIDGAWWLLAQEAFRLPAYVAQDLVDIADALFLFLDVVGNIYKVGNLYKLSASPANRLPQLLEHKAPLPLIQATSQLAQLPPVYALRPDFQLCIEEGRIQPVATELEIAPSAHGFAHAMQLGYALEPDLVEQYAAYLNGRPLLFVGTAQWSEFLLEQLAFCKALAQLGARAYVLYDKPVRTLADEVMAGRRWQPPMFGIPTKPPDWNGNIWERIEQHGLTPFIFPNDHTWPRHVDDAVIFRFGYGVNFSAQHLAHIAQWSRGRATLLNPLTFYLDSKALLGALQLPQVREQIAAASASALAVLDRAIPETHVLGLDDAGALLRQLLAEREGWLIKFAAFDDDNRAWGGRSVQLGAQQSDAQWAATLRQAQTLPWPVVAQRLAPSLRTDIPYVDRVGAPGVMRNGVTRLRSFLLRHADGATTVGGSHLTISPRQQVSEGTDTVQAPVVFA